MADHSGRIDALSNHLEGRMSPSRREVLEVILERDGLLPDVPFYAPDLIEVPTPTRVAFAGCWHARREFVEDAMRHAKEHGADVIVHTGDLLYTYPSANKMLMEMERVAEDLDMFVVSVRGNHDDPALFKKAATSTRRRNKNGVVSDGFARFSSRILHAPNGLHWNWQGVEFVALGGAFSVDRAARVRDVSYWEGEVATPREIGAVKRGGRATVVVTHDIPAGTHLPFGPTRPDWWDIASAEKHRRGLRGAIDVVRPDWVIGGHMHFRFSDGIWLDETKTEQAHQVRVEVLDQIEQGIEGNMMVADLRDGEVLPL